MSESKRQETKAKAENSVCPKCGSTELGALVEALAPGMLFIFTDGEWVVDPKDEFIGDWANADYYCNDCEWTWGTGRSRYQGDNRADAGNN